MRSRIREFDFRFFFLFTVTNLGKLLTPICPRYQAIHVSFGILASDGKLETADLTESEGCLFCSLYGRLISHQG